MTGQPLKDVAFRTGGRRPGGLAALVAVVIAALAVIISCETRPRQPGRDKRDAPSVEAADANSAVPSRPASRPSPAAPEPAASPEQPEAAEAAAVPAPPEKPEEEAPSLVEQVLELNLVHEPELDLAAARAAFERTVDEARGVVEGKTRPREVIAALNRVILLDRKVEYLSEKTWRDSTLAAALLRGRGNCMAVTTLYFLVARELGLPVRPVEVPGHVFVRWDDGDSRINIETTARGAETRDTDYETLARSTYAEVIEAGWGRSTTDEEFLAMILVNAARHRIGERRQEEALPFVRRAIQLAAGRPEYLMLGYRVLADVTGERERYQRKIDRLGARSGTGSREVVQAMMLRARDLSDAGEHAQARELLMKAFPLAPRSELPAVLRQLAFCYRAVRDYRSGRRYMELVAALKPGDAGTLYNLAILEEDDGDVEIALETIRRALEINPSSWNLLVMQAGFTVHAGRREKGLELFSRVERPRADEEFFDIMTAWFYSVAGPRERFYGAFEKALSSARTTGILSWVDEDRDLDPYREDQRFKALVARHRERLLGEAEEGEPGADEPAGPVETGEPEDAPEPVPAGIDPEEDEE